MILITFVLFTGLVGLLTWLLTRKADHSTSQGYFLAGRSLTFPVIAGSLLLTNLSTEQMVGLNGAAFVDGLSVMAWEVVAVLALVVMALFFLPRFLKSGIATLPQYLGVRFDAQTGAITNMIFLVAYAVILLPIILYTGATGLSGILNVPSLTGIESQAVNLWLMVWLVGIIGSVYALFGGLRVVAVSDTLNGIGLLVGGFLVVYFGLQMVSDQNGVWAGFQVLKEAHPEKMDSIGREGQSVPFATLFTGVALLNLFYWCTNQQIIQRTLGASSLAEGQKGVFLTAGLKLLGPLYLVLPGIIAYHLFAADGIRSDHAYGMLVNHVLPAGLVGFFAAVMVGAILSSFNSALNSTCTLFSLGVYQTVINPEATDEQVVRSGRVFGWILAVAAMTIAPLLAGVGGIFAYLQKMNGLYFIPIFAVVVIGFVTKKVPAIAAKVGLVVGFVVIAIGYFIPPFDRWVEAMNEFHFLGAVFAVLCVTMLVIGWVKPRSDDFVQVDVKAVDMTPWKGRYPVSIGLVVVVLGIYVGFAAF